MEGWRSARPCAQRVPLTSARTSLPRQDVGRRVHLRSSASVGTQRLVVLGATLGHTESLERQRDRLALLCVVRRLSSAPVCHARGAERVYLIGSRFAIEAENFVMRAAYADIYTGQLMPTARADALRSPATAKSWWQHHCPVGCASVAEQATTCAAMVAASNPAEIETTEGAHR